LSIAQKFEQLFIELMAHTSLFLVDIEVNNSATL